MANISFLKWAGGKTQLAPVLLQQYPKGIARYIEPFFGSGSMVFEYIDAFKLKPTEIDFGDNIRVVPPVVVNDNNPLLMNCHRIVSEKPAELKARLLEIESEYMSAHSPKAYFYEKRKQVTGKANVLPLELAAIFVFVNKTCFNGIWRVNSRGLFNVPWNKREAVNLPSRQIDRCSDLLSKHVELYSQDFEEFLYEQVNSGDFVFLDPPYIPLSSTSSFTSYTAEGWRAVDDERLADCLKEINRRGAKFMMTNSSSYKVFQLFGQWNINTVDAHRFVKAVKRGKQKQDREKIKETVTTNY